MTKETKFISSLLIICMGLLVLSVCQNGTPVDAQVPPVQNIPSNSNGNAQNVNGNVQVY